MREITMRPTGSLVRAALRASLLSTLPPVLGVSALFAECPLAIAGDNILKQFRPITDQMLQSPDRGDWLMRRGDNAPGVTARSTKSAPVMSAL